jgi:hypothetical protein
MPKRKYGADNSVGGILRSVLYVTLAVIGLTVVFVGASDVQCHNDINMRMPVYPDSELINVEDSGFFRMRGMGLLYAEYSTPDDPETVREWYGNHLYELRAELREQGKYGNPATGLATTDYTVREKDNGNGSIITQQAECGYGLRYQ